MASRDSAQWDARYAGASGGAQPARVLREYSHLLPPQGDALDLACGLGANARLLAARGMNTLAWDYSPVAIGQLASGNQDRLHACVRDVCAQPPSPGSFDVIVVSYFLDRVLFPALLDALKVGGLLYYQTFLRDQVGGGGPRNPAFRLAENELLQLMSPLRMLVYREEGSVGDVAAGFRNEAYAVGMKR